LISFLPGAPPHPAAPQWVVLAITGVSAKEPGVSRAVLGPATRRLTTEARFFVPLGFSEPRDGGHAAIQLPDRGVEFIDGGGEAEPGPAARGSDRADSNVVAPGKEGPAGGPNISTGSRVFPRSVGPPHRARLEHARTGRPFFFCARASINHERAVTVRSTCCGSTPKNCCLRSKTCELTRACSHRDR